MKTMITLILVLSFGVFGLAQSSNPVSRTEVIAMEAALNAARQEVLPSLQTKEAGENSLSRLYKYKNSRVKSALSFRTRKSEPKLV